MGDNRESGDANVPVNDSVPSIQPVQPWLRHPNLVHAYTTRSLGNLSYRSGTREEADAGRDAIARELRIDKERMFSIPLGHTNKVVVVRDETVLDRVDDRGYLDPEVSETREFGGLTPDVYDQMPSDRNYVDGVVFDVPDLYSLVITADCAAVGFFDPKTGACGNAHVGLLGAINQLPQAMVAALEEEFRCEPANIEAVIFPAIRQCHYDLSKSMTWQNIREDVFAAYGEGNPFYLTGFFDLPGFIRLQLIERGIPETQIFDLGLCTVCCYDRFFSHVGAGTPQAQEREGRFGAVVGRH
jgi:copper oxidase (laccase) domain-containing protein